MSNSINQNSSALELHQENKLSLQDPSIFSLLNQSELITPEFFGTIPRWRGAGRDHFARGLVRPASIAAWMLS